MALNCIAPYAYCALRNLEHLDGWPGNLVTFVILGSTVFGGFFAALGQLSPRSERAETGPSWLFAHPGRMFVFVVPIMVFATIVILRQAHKAALENQARIESATVAR